MTKLISQIGLTCLLCACGSTASSTTGLRESSTAGPVFAAPVDFVALEAEVPVPSGAGTLPIYALGPAVAPRAELLRVLQLNYPGIELKRTPGGRIGPLDRRFPRPEGATWEGRLVARLEQGGNIALMPRLAGLGPVRPADREQLDEKARGSLERLNLQQGEVEKQANIRAEMDAPMFVYRSERKEGAPVAEEPVPELAYFKARRMVGEYPVSGPGSKATVTLDADRMERGYARRWKAAKSEVGVAKPPSVAELQQAIADQLKDTGVEHVRIAKVDIVYYDADASVLQPVYRVQAYLSKGGKRELVAVGYVGFQSQIAVDKLPSLANVAANREVPPQPFPQPQPQPPQPQPFDAVPTAAAPARLRVGRFVARGNGTLPFGLSAERFWSGLQLDSRFTNATFEREATSHALTTGAGGLDLVLVEGHGVPALVYMNSTDSDEVKFTDGPIVWPAMADHERAADWILHSCEVISAPPEAPGKWADPWWKTLGNVRSLVGYRTRMQIADRVVEEYGDRLRAGESIVNAWLNAVGESYTEDLTSEVSTGETRPLGRPAAIALCDHDDDTINTRVSRQAPKCLRIRYYDDKL
jgi:hypothetical protein